ncbi:hypothetical protein KAJ27_22615 [bacterium]|nr:hypothetical protein [bacterium]
MKKYTTLNSNSYRASALMLVLIIVAIVSIFALMIANMSSGERTLIEKSLKMCKTQNLFDAFMKIIIPMIRGELKDQNSTLYKELYLELVKSQSEFTKNTSFTIDIKNSIFFNTNAKPSSQTQRKVLLDRLLQDYGGQSSLNKLDLSININPKKFDYYTNVYFKEDREKFGSLLFTLSVDLNGEAHSQQFFCDVKVVCRIPELLGKFNLLIRNALDSNIAYPKMEDRKNRFNLFVNAPEANSLSNKCNVFYLTNGDSKKNGLRWLHDYGGDVKNTAPAQKKLFNDIINTFGWIYLGTHYQGKASELYLKATYGEGNINASEDFLFYMQNPDFNKNDPQNPERMLKDGNFKHDYWEVRNWKMGICRLKDTRYHKFFASYYDANEEAFNSSFLHLFGMPPGKNGGGISPTLVLGKISSIGLKFAGAALNYDVVTADTTGVLQQRIDKIVTYGTPAPPNAATSFPWTPLPLCHDYSSFTAIENIVDPGSKDIFKFFMEDATSNEFTPKTSGFPKMAMNNYPKPGTSPPSSSGPGYSTLMSQFFHKVYNENIDYIITGNSFKEPTKTLPDRFYYRHDEDIHLAPPKHLPLKNQNVVLHKILKNQSELDNFLLPKVAWNFKDQDFTTSLSSKGLLYVRPNSQPVENVLTLDGIIQFKGDITLENICVERGGMIITDGNIYLKGNIRQWGSQNSSSELLVLYTTNGDIKIQTKNGQSEIWASLLAPNGTITTDGILSIYGNAVMDHLHFRSGSYITGFAKYGGTLDYNSKLGILPNNKDYHKTFMLSFNEAMYK